MRAVKTVVRNAFSVDSFKEAREPVPYSQDNAQSDVYVLSRTSSFWFD